jgi:hypothetical protein
MFFVWNTLSFVVFNKKKYTIIFKIANVFYKRVIRGVDLSLNLFTTILIVMKHKNVMYNADSICSNILKKSPIL